MKRIALLLVVLLSACAGQHAITDAYMRDTIFSIEPRLNGTATIWMTHDDVGSYCSRDATIIAKAHAIFASTNPETVVEYRSVNTNDPEWTWFGGVGGGCAVETGSSSGHTTYLVLNIWTLEEYQQRQAQ